MKQFITYIPHQKSAFIGSVIIFVVAIAGFMGVGTIYSDTQARGLIEAMVPSLGTLSFAGITATSTVIALLLTVLGMARRADTEFDKTFYIRMRIIAMLGTVAMGVSIILLLILSIPLTENEALQTFFNVVYYCIMLLASLISALLFGIVITLYETVMGLIASLTPSFGE